MREPLGRPIQLILHPFLDPVTALRDEFNPALERRWDEPIHLEGKPRVILCPQLPMPICRNYAAFVYVGPSENVRIRFEVGAKAKTYLDWTPTTYYALKPLHEGGVVVTPNEPARILLDPNGPTKGDFLLYVVGTEGRPA